VLLVLLRGLVDVMNLAELARFDGNGSRFFWYASVVNMRMLRV
jgi:hypothetical protein